MRFERIKADTQESQPHVIKKGEKQEKVTSERQQKAHTSAIPGPK